MSTILTVKKTSNRLSHGHTIGRWKSPTYMTWQSMKSRCLNKKRDVDNKYINRGITICDEWLSFETFLNDMGERPCGLTIERIDNNLGYYKDNCKWATIVEQARNKRTSRLTYQKAFDIYCIMHTGERSCDLAREYNCCENLPREIYKGRAWKDAVCDAKEHIEKESLRLSQVG